MKRICFGILFFFVFSSSFSQQYCNEWIIHSQKYLKFKVFEEGIYRINYESLSAGLLSVGIDINIIDVRNIQLFCKGKEQHIYIQSINPNHFQQGDYIEFYGQKNDGSFDTQLYQDTLFQPNKNYSLFNDTAIYFITINSSTNNKRIILENDINFSSFTPLPFFINKSRIDYVNSYNTGSNPYNSEYTNAEGWCDDPFAVGTQIAKDIPTANAYIAGTNALINIGISGFSETNHTVNIYFPDQTINYNYSGKRMMHFSHTIPSNILGNISTQIKFESAQGLGGTDNNAITYIQIVYAHTFDLEGKTQFKMFVPNEATLKSYLEINNLSFPPGQNVFIYDISNNKKIITLEQGGLLKALVFNTGTEKECLITSESYVKNVNFLSPVNGNGLFTNYLLLPSSQADFLMISHRSLWNEATNYKNYRVQSGNKVLLVDIDDLYDQFSYGISRNPLSIKNFVRFVNKFFTDTIKHLFLIGKSYRAGENSQTMAIYRKTPEFYEGTLVPSFGVPPSDAMFSWGLDSLKNYATIATGRLSAKTPEHISLYFNKIYQYENAQTNPQPWMKNILHFGGGADIGQQAYISNSLNNFKRIIEDTLFGGNVKTALKTSSAPIQTNLADSLKRIINNGVSLMTFFGHAGGVGFDVSLDNPSTFNNYGKYPFLIANSCWSGDIFNQSGAQYGVSSSEAFVLQENKGAIAFLGSIINSDIFQLDIFSNYFYKAISSRFYGKSVGLAIQYVQKQLQQNNDIHNLIKEMTLHGDPSLKINYFSLPDYQIQLNNITLSPAIVSANVDSFEVKIIHRNFGRAVSNDYFISVIRTYPDFSTSEQMYRVHCPYYSDAFSIKLPVNIAYSNGLNKIDIVLDANNEITELNENNNSASLEFNIFSDGIVPVYPYQYAVIPQRYVILKASIGNPFSPNRQYDFEIDTTDLFINPLEKSSIINQQGGLIEWQPSIVLQDSVVYFWRVGISDSLDSWENSSFQYINGKQGYGQAHFYQLQENKYNSLVYKRNNRSISFVNNIKNIKAQTGVYPNIAWTEVNYWINSVAYGYGFTCLNDWPNFVGLNVAVFDTITGEPWESIWQGNGFGQYGNLHCHSYRNLTTFDFPTSDSISQNVLKRFIDTIPRGFYVLVYSIKNHNAQNYTHELLNAFESLGSSMIRNVEDTVAYILFSRKGNSIGMANEKKGRNSNDIITLNDTIVTKWPYGNITSVPFGKATQWKSLHWRVNKNPEDSVFLELKGVLNNNTETSIPQLDTIPFLVKDIYQIEDYFDTNQFQNLKLKLYLRDDSLRTAPSFRSWHLLCESAPETCINPSLYYKLHNNILQQGDSLQLGIAFQNISDFDMDSLLVKYRLYSNNNIVWEKLKRLRKHPAGDTLIDSIALSTISFVGNYKLFIEVNPDNDQIEQYHFNNIAEIMIKIVKDLINPILDVTFDGIHIINGDIVSSFPDIKISLRDENKFFPLNDTSVCNVFHKTPIDSLVYPVYYKTDDTSRMQFTPASAENNICTILYQPELEDGIHTLEVLAKDASGNMSGENNYRIDFVVKKRPGISKIFNWPNPFSERTHFVFTLSGEEIPDIYLEIFDMSGKAIKHIYINEYDVVHIGRNTTFYVWDGTDDYGYKVSQGMYFYKAYATLDGEKIYENEDLSKLTSKLYSIKFGKLIYIR